MPANLNALIRYRTIDRCLSNPYRNWTIADLQEACAEALKEHRGSPTGISERTIRDDIRVMRSDILGFNAPIVQSGGHYTYEDRDYSIFNVTISDRNLLARILEFMLKIRSEVDHPEMERIIGRISEAISWSDYEEDKKADRVEALESAFEPEAYGRTHPRPAKTTLGLSWATILDLVG